MADNAGMRSRSEIRGEEFRTLPETLVQRFGTRDPFRLAEQLGFIVRFINTRNQKGFCREVLGHFFILINRNLSEAMQRMCCAHEIGHILLHREYLSDPAYLMHMELFDMRSRTEYEANLFAANLLVDDGELADYLRSGAELVDAASSLQVNVNMIALKLAEMKKRENLPIDLPFTPERKFLGRIDDRADAI